MASISNNSSLAPSNASNIASLIAGYADVEESSPISQEALVPLFSAVEKASSWSPEETFWGLGEDWWQQLIEENCHDFGRLVFDEGLHDGDIEPGFYQSAHQANHFASLFFLSSSHSLSTPSYQEINKIACSHFSQDKGSKNRSGILMDAKDAGKFTKRPAGHHCRMKVSDYYTEEDWNTVLSEKGNLTVRTWNAEFISVSVQLIRDLEIDQDEITAINLKMKEVRDKCCDRQAKRIADLNDYIATRSKALGLSKTVATISCFKNESRYGKEGTLVIFYQATPEESEILVKNLFAEFEANIAKAKTREEVIRCIADLYQMLEWAHPFKDGQGRTDLTLLSTMLCKYGLNPAILDEPYFSTFGTLDEWVAVLTIGIQKWKDKYFSRVLAGGGLRFLEMPTED